MHATLLNRIAAWRWFLAARQPLPGAAFPSSREVAQDLAATDALDRCTAWPTHRIRCALHTRREEPESPSR
jgi:hypothetical protein